MKEDEKIDKSKLSEAQRKRVEAVEDVGVELRKANPSENDYYSKVISRRDHEKEKTNRYQATKEEAKLEMIKNLLKSGVEINKIAEASELSKGKIKGIKEKI